MTLLLFFEESRSGAFIEDEESQSEIFVEDEESQSEIFVEEAAAKSKNPASLRFLAVQAAFYLFHNPAFDIPEGCKKFRFSDDTSISVEARIPYLWKWQEIVSDGKTDFLNQRIFGAWGLLLNKNPKIKYIGAEWMSGALCVVAHEKNAYGIKKFCSVTAPYLKDLIDAEVQAERTDAAREVRMLQFIFSQKSELANCLIKAPFIQNRSKERLARNNADIDLSLHTLIEKNNDQLMQNDVTLIMKEFFAINSEVKNTDQNFGIFKKTDEYDPMVGFENIVGKELGAFGVVAEKFKDYVEPKEKYECIVQ